MRKHRGEEMISLTAKVSRNAIALATSLHGIGTLIQDGTFRKRVVEIEPPWHCPKEFSLLEIEMPNFSMELLMPKQITTQKKEVILQLHGGGYIGKMKNAYRDFAVLYGKMPGERMVLSVDYRVAPEHPYPAALKDAYLAYSWLLEHGYEGNQIVIAGDSAGGGLALALALYLRDHEKPLPKKLILMSPWTDLAATGESYQTNFEKDPLFGNTKESMIYSNDYYGDLDPKIPYISPLYGEYEGLPPMLFQVGSTEMLLSDSIRAAKKAKEAGCMVKLSVYNGMFHVFQLGMKKMKESREAWEEVERFLLKD